MERQFIRAISLRSIRYDDIGGIDGVNGGITHPAVGTYLHNVLIAPTGFFKSDNPAGIRAATFRLTAFVIPASRLSVGDGLSPFEVCHAFFLLLLRCKIAP